MFATNQFTAVASSITSPLLDFARSQTVVPAPAVSCLAASPLTTATSTQPELPGQSDQRTGGLSP